ncbi:MAG: PAS domain-containing protein [Myxococcota bacterium]
MDDERRSRQELIDELKVLRTRLAHFERLGDAEFVHVRPMPEQVPAYLWTADHELRLMWSRPSYASMVGFGTEPDLGTTVYDLFSRNEDHPSIQAHRAALEGEARNFEVWVEVLGDPRLLRAHVEPLRDASQTILGVVGVAMDLTERVRADQDRERLIEELRHALDRVKVLSGLIPICTHCKAVRDDKGYWQQVDAFMREHSDAKLSHGICPECAQKLMPT